MVLPETTNLLLKISNAKLDSKIKEARSGDLLKSFDNGAKVPSDPGRCKSLTILVLPQKICRP